MAAVKRPPNDGRARLLEAAARVLAADGPSALTVNRLAREVGASTMAIYTNFSGKDALIAATADEFLRRFAERLKAVPHTDDPLADMVALADAYRGIAADNPHLYRVGFQQGRLSVADDTPRGVAEIFDYCAAMAGRCVEVGIFRPGEPGPTLMVLWTGVHGQVSMELERVFPSAEAADDAWDETYGALLVGLGAQRDHVIQAQRRRRCAGVAP